MARSSRPPDLRKIAVRLAQTAGEFVSAERGKRAPAAESKSTPTDPVTVVDKASEQLIREILRRDRPEDGVLGEEDEPTAGSSGVTWVIDPIDGTVNFVYGLPAYAVSIAAVRGTEILAGAVHNPVSKETWNAELGGGAWLGDAPIAVSRPADLSMTLVATGFSYIAAERREQAALVLELMTKVRDIRRIGAAALDLCNVACGRVDAYYEVGLKPWDCAAGLLIAREAGAVVSSGIGHAVRRELVFAATPAIADELAALVGLDRDRLVYPR